MQGVIRVRIRGHGLVLIKEWSNYTLSGIDLDSVTLDLVRCPDFSMPGIVIKATQTAE